MHIIKVLFLTTMDSSRLSKPTWLSLAKLAMVQILNNDFPGAPAKYDSLVHASFEAKVRRNICKPLLKIPD